MTDCVDIFVIGGGINGAGIARDAAGRGLSVILCEKDDLAEGTSSRSGKLVHGGLRYLEYYEFRLVREALIEREVLLNAASHIIWPMRFVLPHSPDDRPAWLVRLGLFLYDHLGGRKKLPGTRVLDLHRDPEGASIKDAYKKGFEYSDCWVDDARLVVLNALDAAQRGCQVLIRTACTSIRRQKDCWHIETKCQASGVTTRYRAKAVVNAGGPWVNDIVRRVAGGNSSRKVRLVKGSHIIVPKFWDGQQAYLVQNTDKRVIFVNPYGGDKALIGTTDISYDGPPEDVAIDDGEIAYLLDAVNRYFKRQLHPRDILDAFSGVRPLYDDGQGNPSAVTRDYVFDLDDKDHLPLLNVFGGKITTFRKLAEHAVQKLKPYFPKMGADWTAKATLPGGDMEGADFERFVNQVIQDFPWLPDGLAHHYARLFGTRLYALLDGAQSVEDLGQYFGGRLYEIEAVFVRDTEWVRTADDMLLRRSKHHLQLTKDQRQSFEHWFSKAFEHAAP